MAGHGDRVSPCRPRMIKCTLLLPILALCDALFIHENVLILLIHGTIGTAGILILTLLEAICSGFGSDWILGIARRRHITWQLQLSRP